MYYDKGKGLKLGLLTDLNRRWLDSRFRRDPQTKVYFAHEPIYGLFNKNSEPGHIIRYARLSAILHAFESLSFKTFVDIGGAEGYLSYLVSRLFKARVVTTDLSFQANCRASELFDLPSVTLQSSALPFSSNSFDIVTCIETLEHVEYPIETLFELYRVAKKYLIISSDQLCETERDQRKKLERRKFQPHFEKNCFLIDDFKRLFPNLVVRDYSHIYSYLSGDPFKADSNILKILLIPKKTSIPFKIVFTEQIIGLIRSLLKSNYTRASNFLLNHEYLNKKVRFHIRLKITRLLNFLLTQRFHEILDVDLSKRRINPSLKEFLRCPTCKSNLLLQERLICEKCKETFSVKAGIPILLPKKRKYPEKYLLKTLSKSLDEQSIKKIVELKEKFEFPLTYDKRLPRALVEK